MKTGYMVVYKHNGHELSAGNPTVFPVKELAEKYLRNYAKYPWFDKELYITEREYKGKELEPCGEYNGKQVYNNSWYFGINALEVGDYVEEDIVDDLMDCLPPACMRRDCSQIGEPSTQRYDDKIGKWKSTFATFKKVSEGVWEYCGDCFRGENIMRGKERQYC